MSQSTAMNELAAHKRLLVLESELNRQNLRTHCANIEGSLDGAKRFVRIGRAASPLLMLAVGAGGFQAMNKRRALTGVLGRALSSWQLFQSLKPIWNAFAKRGDSDEAKAPADPAQLKGDHE